jgi:TRAP-type C4-dicarboxylate transport system permease small subunit
MMNLTLPNLLALGALLALLAIMVLVPKAPFAWQRWLGFLSLVIGAAGSGALLALGGWDAWRTAGRAAAEQFLLLYVLGTATWLAWKAARPF